MTTTYFENLKGALASANRLLKQEDQAQHTISQGAKTSLYYAHGATVKAEIELEKQVARSDQANRLYTSVVRSKQNSDNLLTASKAAVTSAKGTNSKISKAAVKFQSAANALTQLSSHMASVMAITSASDQGSKMDQLVNQAYERTKKAAQDAEQASLVSLDSTIEASQSIAAHVVQKAQSLNGVLRAMQTAINTQMEAINGQVTSNLQTHAEALDTENTNAGIFKSAHLETMATDNSRRYINEQTNYDLTLEDVGLPNDKIRKALRPDLETLEQKHARQKERWEKNTEAFVATLQSQQEKVEIALKRTGAEERIRTEQLLMLKEFQQQELAVQRKLLEALVARDLRNQVWQMHLAEHGGNQEVVRKVATDFKKAMKEASNEPVNVPEAVCLFFGFKVDDKFTLKKLDKAVRNVAWNPLENYLNPYALYMQAKSALTVRYRNQHGDTPTKHEVDAAVKNFVSTAPESATTAEFSRLVEEEWSVLVKRKDAYIASLEALYQGNMAALQRKDEEVIHGLKEEISLLRYDWLDLEETEKEQLVKSQAESVVNSASVANQNALEQFKQVQASELEILEKNRSNELELLAKRQKQELSVLKGSQTREMNNLKDVQKADEEDLQNGQTVFVPREELSRFLPGNLRQGDLPELHTAHDKERDAMQSAQLRTLQDRKDQHARQQVEVEERFNNRKEMLVARQAEDYREKEAEVAEVMEEVRQTKEAEALRPFFKYIPPQHTLDLMHTLTVPGLGRSLTVTFQAYKNFPAGYRVVFVEESEVGSINWERITHLPKGHYMEISDDELVMADGTTPYRSYTRVYLTKEGKEELQVVRQNNKVALAAFEQAVHRLNAEEQEDPRHNFAIDLRQTAFDYKGNPLKRGGTYQALIFGLDEGRLKNPDTAASQISEPSAPMYLAQELTTALPIGSFVASIAAPPLALAIHKHVRRANSQLHRLAPGTFRGQGQQNQFFYLFMYKDLQGNLTMETLFNIPKLAKEREQLNPYLGGEAESLSEYRVMLMRHQEVVAYLANQNAKAINQALLAADYRYRKAIDEVEFAQEELNSLRQQNTNLKEHDEELEAKISEVQEATGRRIQAEAHYEETLRKTLETNQQLPSHFTFDRDILKAEPSSNWITAEPVNQQLNVKDLGAQLANVEEEANQRILQLRSQALAYEEAQAALESAERGLNAFYLESARTTEQQAEAKVVAESSAVETPKSAPPVTAEPLPEGAAEEANTTVMAAPAEDDTEGEAIPTTEDEEDESTEVKTPASLQSLSAEVQNAKFRLSNAKVSFDMACKAFNLALSDYVNLFFELNIVTACNLPHNKDHYQIYRGRAEHSSAVTNFGEPVADAGGFFHAVQLTELKPQYAARASQYVGQVSGFSNMASVLELPSAQTLAEADELDTFTLEGFRNQYLPQLDSLFQTDKDLSDDFDPSN